MSELAYLEAWARASTAEPLVWPTSETTAPRFIARPRECSLHRLAATFPAAVRASSAPSAGVVAFNADQARCADLFDAAVVSAISKAVTAERSLARFERANFRLYR